MSEERLEQEEREDEDVEAHKRHATRSTAASDELGDDDESDDVEAHRRHTT